MSADNPRVLSIQSHVVSGYVGNKSATFPLQLLGFEVDAINSVQFSNHTGYSVWNGQVLNADDLGHLYDGLKANDINTYTHLLTGYIGCKSFLLKVADLIADLKKKNPNLRYVCDPVMGDNGKMYVPEDLLPVYREKIIPLADVITPNQFEAELLTGTSMTDEASAQSVMTRLHELGAKDIVISSSDLGGKDRMLVAMGSSKQNGSDAVRIRMEVASLPAIFVGSGDLFAALLLAWSHRHPTDLKLACEKTMSTVQYVLKSTLKYAQEKSGEETPDNRHLMELRLIQSKAEIEDPSITVHASSVV